MPKDSTEYWRRRAANNWNPLRLPTAPLAAYLRSLPDMDWQLAQRIGVHPSRVAHVKNEYYKTMNPDTIDKYCIALDVPMSHLYPMEDDND